MGERLHAIAGLLRTLVEQNATIIEQLAALPAAIAAAGKRGSVLSRRDRTAHPALLAAIRKLKSGEVFAAKEIIDDPRVRKTLTRHIGPLDNGSARRLGCLLERLAGVEHDGLRFVRVGESRGRALWKCESMTELTPFMLPHSDIRHCA